MRKPLVPCLNNRQKPGISSELARQIFAKAIRWRMNDQNPFDGREVWSLLVRSPKTEHHGDGHAQRFVPVSADLLATLDDCRRHAAAVETRIVPSVTDGTVNLRTEFTRIVARAGIEPWEKPFQNLRSSCETDWLEMFPGRIAAVAGWMGHSPTVAMRHYAQVLPHHFGGADVEQAAHAIDCAQALSTENREPLPGGARPPVKVAQNPAQQPAALSNLERQAENAETRNPRERRGSPRIVRPEGSQRVGATGFEPATSTSRT